MNINLLKKENLESWDEYVLNHPDSRHCHLSGWGKILHTAYGHSNHNLIAFDNSKVVGIFPLVLIKSRLFGKKLVSMPFLNYGGMLVESEEISFLFVKKLIDLFSQLDINEIELRNCKILELIKSGEKIKPHFITNKVNMILPLDTSSEDLFNSFKAKLRSQIRRPMKEGMKVVLGGEELIDDFYKIFAINMRDLGSPVHSKLFFQQILKIFPASSKIGLVRFEEKTVAAGLIFCFKNYVEIPWASSLRSYNRLSPNMLLYWNFIKYAADNGYQFFDFGRSSVSEGTYKFKAQWGSSPQQLNWLILNNSDIVAGYENFQSKKMIFATKLWMRLPVSVANLLGPKIRKNIPL